MKKKIFIIWPRRRTLMKTVLCLLYKTLFICLFFPLSSYCVLSFSVVIVVVTEISEKSAMIACTMRLFCVCTANKLLSKKSHKVLHSLYINIIYKVFFVSLFTRFFYYFYLYHIIILYGILWLRNNSYRLFLLWPVFMAI